MRAAFAAVRSPGRLERVAAGRTSPPCWSTPRTTRTAPAALAAALTTEFRFTRLVAVVAAMRDKDVRGILAELEPVVAEVVVIGELVAAGDGPGRAGRAGRGGVRLRAGERRARAGQAIEQARELAEEEGSSGAGVIVTGSVVTAGEARRLFGLEPA